MNQTIGKLAKKYGLSRSTLLYYDRIGLLKPGKHQKGEYRTYGSDEEERLQFICLYRTAGLSLEDIRRILDNPETNVSASLTARFRQLDQEIRALQDQQRVIGTMLQNPALTASPSPMSKELWTRLLSASGMSEEAMRSWHIQFESSAPEEHQLFLRYLRISEEEIAEIRSWSA